MKSNRTTQYRKGFSTIETLVALALLGMLMLLVGKFATHVRGGLEQRRLAKVLQWELENGREIVGSWPVDQISQERIAHLPFSALVQSELDDLEWYSEVRAAPLELPNHQTNDMSVPALQIRLGLRGTYQEQQLRSNELSFWVLSDGR